jgi:hypothetical protein
VIALAIAAVAVREGRDVWAGEGCACVAVPGLEADSCGEDCRLDIELPERHQRSTH